MYKIKIEMTVNSLVILGIWRLNICLCGLIMKPLFCCRKHALNCHRMKPALFNVLCEIKEKTGTFTLILIRDTALLLSTRNTVSLLNQVKWIHTAHTQYFSLMEQAPALCGLFYHQRVICYSGTDSHRRAWWWKFSHNTIHHINFTDM